MKTISNKNSTFNSSSSTASSTYFSSSSSSKSEESSTQRVSSVSSTDSKPKGFVSTMKRHSLSATQMVHKDSDGTTTKINNDAEKDIGRGEVAKTAAIPPKKGSPNEPTLKKTESNPKTVKKSAQPTKLLPPPPMDVVLLLDGSSSITEPVFKGQVLQFCKEFARQMGVSRTGNHLALVQFSSYSRTEFGLSQYFNPQKLEEAITNIRYMNGGTMLGKALNYTHKTVLNMATRKDSTVANKVLIVITDGASDDDVETPAKVMREENVHIITVGVGPGVNQKQLITVANNAGNVYTVKDFAQLNNALIGRLRAKMCENVVEEIAEEDEAVAEEQKEVEQQIDPTLQATANGRAKNNDSIHNTTTKSEFSEHSSFREL